MKNLTWQNPEQLFVAQELINKVKSKCCGIKVYLLHRGYEIVYIGQATKQSIVFRLEQHTKDDLANKWDTFSWFGFFNVNEENGKINTSCKSIKMDLNKVAETLEALLIESIEPRFNRKRGDNFSDKEYQQII